MKNTKKYGRIGLIGRSFILSHLLSLELLMSFRDDFKKCAEGADLMRDVFGDGVKLIYASEGGRVVETSASKQQEGMVEVSSEQWLEMGRLSQRNADYVNKGRK